MTTRIRITRVTDGDDIARQMLPHMEALGSAVGARMQRLIPKRTWAAHDTIQSGTERNGSRIRTTIGVGNDEIDYPIDLEYGTSKMRAQPFMRPALDQSSAGDLNYSGRGIVRHGIRTVTTRRTRLRGRGGS